MHGGGDQVSLVDDGSADSTAQIARTLNISVFVHPRNRGYGANQKTCYREALRTDADIIAMLHPDYQYSPRLVTAMCSMIASDEYDAVLGSRILVRALSRTECLASSTTPTDSSLCWRIPPRSRRFPVEKGS